jgi:hypothetical protein
MCTLLAASKGDEADALAAARVTKKAIGIVSRTAQQSDAQPVHFCLRQATGVEPVRNLGSQTRALPIHSHFSALNL